ncbi:MFS general substrate transporter [Polyplosphaeria fusca]|uniref:MFS general substrate transporter n=1 Tax=Polyplosphaeria fusca TaxID=682080 RepID=A0A9P4QKE2_9PLEO|nr:MFS general substrate transporter [Polyplosphaeria fusca]
MAFKQAFNLSKSEVANASPPGTVTLIEHLEHLSSHPSLRLVPHPSSDPSDPLTFPPWRKLSILSCISLLPFVVNFTSASISSAFVLYASTPVFGFPPKSFSELSHLLAVNVLMLGVSNLWWVPLANTVGRRPVVLVSLLLLVFSSLWAGLAKSFGSLLAARFFMGCAGGPADAVAPAVVGEVFFVHQRGRAMAVYTVFLAMGSLVGAISGGYIAFNHGLRWLHWTNVIMAAITFALCFLLLPETLYQRPAETNVTASASEKPTTEMQDTTAAEPSHRPFTFTRSLKLSTYRPGILQKLIAPWLTLRLPGVWLVSLWYAGLVGGIVTLSAVGPQLVSAPPYLWGKDASLISVGGVIGTFVGGLYTYLVADWTTKRLAKKERHGFSEPESRLITALPALFIATVGLLVFGFVGQNASPTGWVGLEFGFGMLALGLMQAPSVGFNYLIESYPSISGDCFVAVTCVRAVVAFAWTFFVGTWVTEKGPAEPFGIFGMLMGIFGLLTIPVYVWGKRMRIATAQWVPEGVGM